MHAFWLLGAYFLLQLYSSEMMAKFSQKSVNPQMDTIEGLINSDLNVVIYKSFPTLHSIENKHLLSKLYEKTKKHQTMTTLSDLFDNNKWITGVSDGKSAIFLYEVPLKLMVIQNMKRFAENIRFRFMAERYGQPFMLTIATSLRLSRRFRYNINIRYELTINI
jgi:hypothetical protein